MLGRAVRHFNVVDEGAHLPLSLAGSRWEEALVALIQRAGTNSICYCQHWDLREKKGHWVPKEEMQSVEGVRWWRRVTSLLYHAHRWSWGWLAQRHGRSGVGSQWRRHHGLWSLQYVSTAALLPKHTQACQHTETKIYGLLICKMQEPCTTTFPGLWRQEAKCSPGVIPALFTTVFVQEILHSIVLFLETLFNSNTMKKLAILPKSRIYIL